MLHRRVNPSTRISLAVGAMALGGFGIGTTEFAAMGLLPDIAADLGVSEPVAGHVIAAYALGVVVGAPLIAAAFARVQRRTLLVALMVAFTLGNTLSVIAPNYETLMAARFIAGLPHGAFFGVAALVAAHLAGPAGRGRAVGQVLMGLSVANVIGVPLTTWLGDSFGWRYALSVVVVIGAATVIALLVWLPAVDIPVTNPLTELGALRRPQVWFALLTGVVGFGGMFAVYTYISTTLTSVSGLEKSAVPFVLAVYGVGMVIGNVVGGRAADFSVNRSIVATLAGLVVLQALFSAFAPEPVAAISLFFLIGLTGSALVPALQTRLMDVAGEAQTLAATLNHSALNIANALGAFLGGAVIAAGYGYTAPALVGSGLAVAGLGVFGIGLLAARRAPEPVGARR
ncbi:MFS transporter [Tsukamurella strandjordii]|uniref:MFS transporter n=2 Tax=Tsukamurella strandjordii TaxID=147577 RepID=A0AA90SJU7_9ACTN|nr:MFS transporter [Tsukamurella strandjordii]MDP0396487.1 MFS transporter [Tsukamurella strandjordii]